MRRSWILFACVLLGLVSATPAALAGQEEPATSLAPPTPPTVLSQSRVIVEWAPGASRADRVDARNDAEVDFASDLGNRRFQLVEVEPGQTARDAARELEANPAVAVAERDGYSAPNAIPNDPLFGELWGLRSTGLGINGFAGAVAGADVNAPAAWDRTVGTPTTVIADIDTGYRYNDAELSSVAWTNTTEASGTEGVDDDGNGIVDDIHGADFVGSNADAPISTPDGNPTDDNLISGGHGIHTAGTMGAAGNNEVGITGVAQNVRIMALRVCSNSASAGNEARCPFSSEVAAINYAGAKGARAANMSLGGTFNETVVRDAIAANPGTLYVISAGNDAEDNDSIPHFPCNYNPLLEGKSAVDNVICVAATDQADGLASFSDWGANSVDLSAPGTEILSTYPGLEVSFHDDFEANDFSTTWSQTGAEGFGPAAAGDGPLTSFGMSDSPNQAPAPASEHDVRLTNGVAIPPGTGACTLSGKRYRNVGSGSTYYQVLSDGSSAFFNNIPIATPSFAMTPFNTAPITGLGGHSVKLRFGFTAGAETTPTTGIWFDDLGITCYKPASAPLDYHFLQGTSMAAPHVTGAAGLLFSLKPLATVDEVRNALLAGVDAVPSLAGKTTTGGRLDIAKAMDSLEGNPVDSMAPAKPALTSTDPEPGANNNHPKIKGSAEAGSTVRIFNGFECAGAPVATGAAAQLSGAGIEVTVPDNSITFFSAQATDAARNESACSTTISYLEDTPPPEFIEVPPDHTEVNPPETRPQQTRPPPLPMCKVPKVVGMTLGQATGALSRAGCKVSAVIKPKARKGRKKPPLVVKGSTPPAGGSAGEGKVTLILGPKPKPKKRHH